MLTRAQISRMRRTAKREFLVDTATILRRELEDDGAGGKRERYPADGPKVKCRLSTVSERTRARDRSIGARIDNNEGFLVAFSVGTDVLETDRLFINGSTYQIVSPANERSEQVLLRFVLRRL